MDMDQVGQEAQVGQVERAEAAAGAWLRPAQVGDPPRAAAVAEGGTSAASVAEELEGPWPDPPEPAAFRGLAGDLVRLVDPYTEADPVGVLVQFLVAFGCAGGRGPYVALGPSRQHLNLFCVIVGRTARGRKRTALEHVEQLFEMGGEEVRRWLRECVDRGLVSGEGLIWRVRDDVVLPNGDVVEGVADKRLLVIEEEFGNVLQALGRQGNTLSARLREAWDSGNLSSMSKHFPGRATGAHISVIAHVTPLEVVGLLDRTDMVNGFGNRFLWVLVRKSKDVPWPSRVPQGELEKLGLRLEEALHFARGMGELEWSEEARELWVAAYPELTRERQGLYGDLVARAGAQCVRLAAVYACLDCSPVVRAGHLEAALAVWRYCERCVAHLFGHLTGHDLADEILAELRAAGEAGLSRTQLRDLFARHRRRFQIEAALRVLEAGGFVRRAERRTGGRSAEVWYAT